MNEEPRQGVVMIRNRLKPSKYSLLFFVFLSLWTKPSFSMCAQSLSEEGAEPITVSRESYFAVEKLIQAARLQAIRLALEASGKGRGGSEQDVSALTREQMRVGLTQLADSGLKVGDRDQPIRYVPQDSYIYLEKRLTNLRLAVLRQAETAKQSVEQAWETLQHRPLFLRELLVSE